MCAACVMRVPGDVYLIRSFCLFLSIENLKISNLKSDCVAKTIEQSPWSIWKITRAFSSCLQNNLVVYSLLPTAVVQCKSAVLYSSGPHLQYHSWFNKYLLWPDCLMSPCISPSELQLGSCVSSLSDWNTNTPHVCGSRAGEVCSAPLPWPDCLDGFMFWCTKN